MANKQEAYEDIPGTWCRCPARAAGLSPDQFLYSLMKAENRKEVLADERKYVLEFPTTEEQREAVMKRAWNRMLELGGVSYALAKLAFTDGKPTQFMASQMVGVAEKDYVDMMRKGGRSLDGWRSKKERERPDPTAKIAAGFGTSHTPAIGAALDLGKVGEPYWAPRSPATRNQGVDVEGQADVAIVIDNVDVNAFDFRMIPTFAIGCGAEFTDRRRRLGPWPVPVVKGAPRLRLAYRAVAGARRLRHDSSSTSSQVDDGLTVPLSWPTASPRNGRPA